MFSNTTIMGRLASDLDVRTVGEGVTLVKGAVAFSRRAKIKGEWTEKTSYIDFALFGKRAEVFAQYHSKGSPVHLTGVLDQERWEDKQGQKRSRIVLADVEFTFVPGQKSDPHNYSTASAASVDEADAPF